LPATVSPDQQAIIEFKINHLPNMRQALHLDAAAIDAAIVITGARRLVRKAVTTAVATREKQQM
jgi:hypothetical protein